MLRPTEMNGRSLYARPGSFDDRIENHNAPTDQTRKRNGDQLVAVSFRIDTA
jgi:hypothetical protein